MRRTIKKGTLVLFTTGNTQHSIDYSSRILVEFTEDVLVERELELWRTKKKSADFIETLLKQKRCKKVRCLEWNLDRPTGFHYIIPFPRESQE